jgi:hypothetical protein
MPTDELQMLKWYWKDMREKRERGGVGRGNKLH